MEYSEKLRLNIAFDSSPTSKEGLQKIKEEILKEFDKLKISDGYVLHYKGKLFGALENQVTFTTACYETKNQLDRIYTEGFNSGIEYAKNFIRSNNYQSL